MTTIKIKSKGAAKLLALCVLGTLLLPCFFGSCRKMVEVEPPSSRIVRSQVFVDDASATSAILGIYSEMYGSAFASSGTGSVRMLTGLSSDELINYAEGDYDEFYANNLGASNGQIRSSLWGPGYKFIYYANSIIEGLNTATGVSDGAKNQLLGEAKFLRAFCYFYLVNMFSDVPVATTTDFRVNNTLSRSTVNDVYKLILSDLNDAAGLLKETYPSSERIRPNVFTAKALLGRVYLYLGDNEKAEEFASQVITSGLYQLEGELDNVFLNISHEAIWQMKPLNSSFNTNEANANVLYFEPLFVSLRPSLLDSFSVTDKRRQNWIGSITPDTEEYQYIFKYKRTYYQSPFDEYSTVFRLAELFLIRAEARANSGNIGGAIEDVDKIRKRAGIELIADSDPNISKTQLLDVIMRERLRELFGEWGHRWFDLKRTGRVAKVLGVVKGANWDAKDALYPIPSLERIANNNLSQNEGY